MVFPSVHKSSEEAATGALPLGSNRGRRQPHNFVGQNALLCEKPRKLWFVKANAVIFSTERRYSVVLDETYVAKNEAKILAVYAGKIWAWIKSRLPIPSAEIGGLVFLTSALLLS